LAACATQGKFLPITLGSGLQRHQVMSAAMGVGNPCQELVEEIENASGQISVVLSLGSGHPGVIYTSSIDEDEDWLKILKDMVGDCEELDRQMQQKMDNNLYFRFNVDQGTQQYYGDNIDRLVWLNTQSSQYLDHPAISRLLNQCVSRLRPDQFLASSLAILDPSRSTSTLRTTSTPAHPRPASILSLWSNGINLARPTITAGMRISYPPVTYETR
jgi:hypothetical protein